MTLQCYSQGIWLCFDDCKVAPLAYRLHSKADPSARAARWRLNALNPDKCTYPDSGIKPVHERLLFVPAVARTISRLIAGKKRTIQRRQAPLTSALDRAIQSPHKKTCRGGLISDMGNMNTDRDVLRSAM